MPHHGVAEIFLPAGFTALTAHNTENVPPARQILCNRVRRRSANSGQCPQPRQLQSDGWAQGAQPVHLPYCVARKLNGIQCRKHSRQDGAWEIRGAAARMSENNMGLG